MVPDVHCTVQCIPICTLYCVHLESLKYNLYYIEISYSNVHFAPLAFTSYINTTCHTFYFVCTRCALNLVPLTLYGYKSIT